MNPLFWILMLPSGFGVLYLILLIVGLLVRTPLDNDQAKPLKQWPRALIMVPHFNEDIKCLLKALKTIDAQEYPEQLTVLLIDDGSTNDIQDNVCLWLTEARRHKYLSIVLQENTGRKGLALDAGLAHVSNTLGCIEDHFDVLIIVDSDTLLAQHAISRLVSGLWQDDQCAAACGHIVPSNPRASAYTHLQYYEYIGLLSGYKAAQNNLGCVLIMAGAFVAHKVSAVAQVGGWGKWVVEDMAWTWKALRLGYRTAYVPQAIAFTNCPTTRQGLFRQRRRWARGRVEAYHEVIDGLHLKGGTGYLSRRRRYDQMWQRLVNRSSKAVRPPDRPLRAGSQLA